MKLMSCAELTLFADCLGVPREISVPFARKVSRMYQSSGTEWTVKYLKTVYTDYVRHHAGLDLVGKWYAKGRDGKPAGCLRPFFREINPKARFGYTQLLRCYTSVISPQVTEEQWSKFYTGVSAKDECYSQTLVEMLTKACDRANITLSYGVPTPYYAYTPSESRSVPDPSGKSRPELDGWHEQHRISKTVLGQQLIAGFQPLFSIVLPHDLDHQIDPTYPNTVGRIGLIQEPGCKLRAVANPNRVFQHALQPLGRSLYALLRTLPWDCTHQQDKAFPVVQEHLKQHRDVFCVDLTGATDYFPLHLQESVLRHITKNDTLGQLRLFLKLSREHWSVPNISGVESIQWTKGQPLGLYPSFASFALTHGVLLYALNACRHDNKFFVLGDDVVILDESLHSRYLKTLEVLGCPTSPTKSIDSNRLAEFGGKLLTDEQVIPQLKWRQVSDDNFIDVMMNLGDRARSLLRPRQKAIYDKVKIIPDFLGGCGLNPEGLPLKDRIEFWLSLVQPDRSSYLLSLSERTSRYFYDVRGRPPKLWTDSFLRDFDQKSALHVLSILRFTESWVPVMGANLRTVAPDLGLQIMSSSRQTTLLQRLSEKLGV